MSGRLVICATPIGNLDDASPRLGRALRDADVVYAEDTRRSHTLLQHLGVERRLRSYFAGNEAARRDELAGHLRAGKTVALITDAGMPGISDPGFSAVRAAVDEGAEVTVVPGPSAVTAAVVVSGLPADRFAFEGFLPRSGGARRRRLESLAAEERTAVLFVAPGRFVEDTRALAEFLGGDRPVAVVRELTKLHEEVWRGTLGAAVERWSDAPPRGEVTLVVAGSGGVPVDDLDVLLARVDELVGRGVGLSAAVRIVAEQTGTRRRRLYEAALRRTRPNPRSPGGGGSRR